jgi:serine phosphatase RsbU (regulator of sigma subunit)
VFARTAASPAFTPGDVTLADELASRAAVCIDNARLYDRERRTALALQRGLLPSRPSIPSGIEVAQLYLPVGDSVVGGDWHDIAPLPGGRAALIVGDAMGHGPEAAAVMVQLRTAAHTLADLDLPPQQVLGRLDAMAAGMDAMAAGTQAAPFATCVYAVIDPAGGIAEIARAGHLPPMLAEPGGPVRLLELPPGLPLGLGAGSFQAARFTLPPGATLALYTDGLVESRTRPIDDGLAALQQALAAALAKPRSTLDGACKTVTRTLREHGEDDITLMLARIGSEEATRNKHHGPFGENQKGFLYRTGRGSCFPSRSPAMFAEPPGKLAGPADRAQPAFGLFPHGAGGDDEQPVTCPERGGGRGDESLIAADDQGDVGLGRQPELENLHPVQP